MPEIAIRMLYGARIMLRLLPTAPRMLLSAPHIAITAPHSTVTAPRDTKTAPQPDSNKIRPRKSVPKKIGTLLLFIIRLLQLRLW